MSQHRLPEPRIRDEFRRELRARLMREAAVVLVPKRRENAWTAWLHRDNAWTSWLRPSLVAGLAALVLTIGAGSAAAGSVPGDVAFGLKRAMEEVRVALTFDEVERVRVLAEIADTRLSELERVASRDDKAPTASDAYAEAVTRFRAAVDALQNAAPEDKSDLAQDVADTAREKHEMVLEWLRERLSEKAKDSVDRALEEERRDTPNTAKDKKGKDNKDKDGEDENGQAPSFRNNTPSPRVSERTSSPRPSERTSSPRATSSPRPTERD